MYVTVQEYKDFAASIGESLGDLPDDELNIQLMNASMFIDSKEPELKGSRVERDQNYAFPRTGLIINGFSYLETEIPGIVKKCQMAIALEINEGVDIYAPSFLLPVVSERIEGAVTVQYASPSSVSSKQRESIAVNLFKQLCKSTGFSIPLIRV